MNRDPSSLRDAIFSRARRCRFGMARLKKTLQQKVSALYRYSDRLCYRFWKYPIPRRVQRLYDMACLYGQLLPYYLAVLLEEFIILLTEGIEVFIWVHNRRVNDWRRDSQPNDQAQERREGKL
jgi:hypothetical protein